MSRTSMENHTYLGGCDFVWETGDKIYVKDDANIMQKSKTGQINSDKDGALFQLPGTYKASESYEVYYTGAEDAATEDNVTIANVQVQTAPNNTKHLGKCGDCGTAIATKNGKNFQFALEHKASYLCFLPYVNNTELGKNIYLTKI